jgi:hypothetical protein
MNSPGYIKNCIMKKLIPLLITVWFIAVQSHAQISPVFAPGGKAIRGYDPVAFFSESKPVMGHDSLTFKWKDATWMFTTKKNKDLFIATPEKYAPQYGGYCAYGTSRGYKAPTEINTWTIVNGKLYFNYDKSVQKTWNKDQQAFIEKADKLWPKIKDKE